MGVKAMTTARTTTRIAAAAGTAPAATGVAASTSAVAGTALAGGAAVVRINGFESESGTGRDQEHGE
jgi:hypothetical protein